jgi:hypothetical protein
MYGYMEKKIRIIALCESISIRKLWKNMTLRRADKSSAL